MDALIYALPMPRCSSCGKVLSHLYPDHLELTRRLTDDLQSTDEPQGPYVGTHSKIDITDFVKTYYAWRKQHPTAIRFEPNNVVARALISLKPLTPAELPFGSQREADGQQGFLNHQLCCLRTFQSNPLLGL
jgi:hypothetical protein